jgi:thioredoxin reductase (NADPH)
VRALTTADADELRERLASGETLAVVCLCAAWCDACRAFRATFDAMAQARGADVHVWIDIEDDASLVGDVDVDTFPTLAVYRGDRLLHYGVSLPHAANVARLVDAAAGRADAVAGAPDAIVGLVRALRELR